MARSLTFADSFELEKLPLKFTVEFDFFIFGLGPVIAALYLPAFVEEISFAGTKG